MDYILLLRGINVGGKNKVSMPILKEQLVAVLQQCFQKEYEFQLNFSLVNTQDFLAEKVADWWEEEMARRDVLFVTQDLTIDAISDSLQAMPLGNERLYIGHKAIFWGKMDEADYLKTAYHKQLIKQAYYRQLTIRNGKTYAKLRELAEERTKNDRLI
ncbi:uncharacterized protein (DUF1697 family) [Streptococcus gallinaceus]|uniref:DUF1697 domain-containing protein n=1 Tax=Streptococcus gallinaceus TaxID=165758 RepID=UPI0020A04D67|nr:DUF1697 domain-containing protein [Streptococcus gallinaceus]MCP1639311.1 uncharacterized protein (DUF1697 family) [Streptococcus gallinaceus]MCP1770045.1 uncharacterized protein (DUF1697 family) [Streptococcus gallinaceus]